MKKTNFQFYATHDEILRFIDEVLSVNDVYVYLVRLVPEYRALEVKHNQLHELSRWTFALFSVCRREINTKEEYAVYSQSPHGDLVMCIGDESETELRESSVGATAEYAVNPAWTKLISRLKKNCLKGAYVVTPQNTRQYYPHIHYSQGAQMAYRKGKMIRPMAGWNYVELISERISGDSGPNRIK